MTGISGREWRKRQPEILDRLADHLQSHEAQAPGAINKDQMPTLQQALAIPDRAANEAEWDWRVAAAALVVLTFAGGGLYWPLHRGAANRYVTETVGRGSVIRTVGGNGTINPGTMEQIGAYVSGKIDAVYCDRGTNVKAGQLCAKIDSRPYQTAIDREKADLALAETRLKKDEAYLARANAALEHSQNLTKRGAISRNTLDKSRTAFEQAQRHTTLDEAEIVRRRTALQSAEIDLSHTEIVSPIDGTVVSRNLTILTSRPTAVMVVPAVPRLLCISRPALSPDCHKNFVPGTFGLARSERAAQNACR